MHREGDPKAAKAVTITGGGDTGLNAQWGESNRTRNSTILWAGVAGNVSLILDTGVAVTFGAAIGENRYPPFSHVRETGTTATTITVGIAW